MRPTSFTCALAALAAICAFSAQAEDIDLFLGGTPTTSDRPNVLFILDNAANFSATANHACVYTNVPPGVSTTPSLGQTAGGLEQCALHEAIKGIGLNADGSPAVNIGFMGYNANNIRDISGQHCGGQSGGCLMAPLMALDATNKETLLAWIRSWRTSGGAGNGFVKADGEATAATMQEAWAYFAGETGLSGRNYSGVKPAVGCGKNYVVFIGNAFNDSGTPGDTGSVSPRTALQNAPGVTSAFTELLTGTYATACKKVTSNKMERLSATFSSNTATHENNGQYADEWARYMRAGLGGKPAITTYSVGVLDVLNCKPEYPALLENMAAVGGGKYFSTTNYAELSFALGTIISEVRADNSVFASVSLPVSVNTQGTYLNQVFIGMFRPDADALPRWAGNLKQYKLALTDPKDPDSLKLVDANDRSAVSASTGFLTDCARSFWTPTSTDTYWSFRPIGDCGAVAADEVSNYPDGQWVEKGGQAYVQRQSLPDSRVIRTCTNATCTGATLTDFTTSTSWITQSMLGAGSSGERTDLINWGRGRDIAAIGGTDEDRDGNEDEARPSIHGDVVHSRPVAINLGTDSAPKVVVFYGANDGMLRAINGNRDDVTGARDFGGKSPGAELWAFLAPEFYPNLKRLRDNSPRVKFFGSTAGAPKPYGLDGPITSWQSGSTTRVYVGARRGGRVVYGFDVSGIANNTLTQPTLLWRVGCSDNLVAGTAPSDSCSTPSIAGLGQTWSSPVVFKEKGATNPRIIMGGGYDLCEDTDSATPCTDAAKGRSVYILDAVTGNLNATLTPQGGRSIIADVFVVKNTDGEAMWAYTADLAANIYRISKKNSDGVIKPLDSAESNLEWAITKIASLGPNRKFHFAPDIVDNKDGTYSLLLGSGDREKPLTGFTNAKSATNYFFMVRDKPADPSWLAAESAKCGGNPWICLASLKVAGSVALSVGPEDRGWYLGLLPGEQVVTSAITVFGVTTFSTHRATDPTPGTCSTSLGEARVYNVGYADAIGATNEQGARSEKLASGGLPPSPVAGLVKLDSGQIVPFLIGGSAASALEGSPPKRLKIIDKPKGRKYWYIRK